MLVREEEEGVGYVWEIRRGLCTWVRIVSCKGSVLGFPAAVPGGQ